MADDPGRYLGFLAVYDVVFAIISWASFEYVVSESCRRRLAAASPSVRSRFVVFYAPVHQDGLNQKIFYFHVLIAPTAYGCCVLGRDLGAFSTCGAR